MLIDNINNFKQIMPSNSYYLTDVLGVTFRLLISSQQQSLKGIVSKAKDTVGHVNVCRNIELHEKQGIVHRIYTSCKADL